MPNVNQSDVVSWSTLPTDRPMPSIARQRLIGQKVMISRVALAQGCVVPSHAHENEQIACIMSGRLKFGLGRKAHPTGAR